MKDWVLGKPYSGKESIASAYLRGCCGGATKPLLTGEEGKLGNLKTSARD